MKNALAFRSAFSAFLRSRLGAAGVEFALLLPMAAFVLAVALESARLSIAYALIERAVEEGIHEAKLNRGAEAETLVKAALEKWRFGVFDPSDLKLTFTSSSSMIDLLAELCLERGSIRSSFIFFGLIDVEEMDFYFALHRIAFRKHFLENA